MSLEQLAEAVVELAAKMALGNPRVPFSGLERGIAERLGMLVEAADARAVDLVEQALRRAVAREELITDDISVDGLFDLLGGGAVAKGEPAAAYGALLRACCWEVLDAVRALWTHRNTTSGSWRPRWRQLYSGGPIRSLA